MNVIIIHGTYGNPEENWFPWLKKELEKLGHSVFVPKFPTPENQNLENWLNVFEDYKKYLDEDTILVGHSLGVPFILTILENINKKIKAAFLVAGFTGLLNNPDLDKINKTISNRNFDFNNIKENCKNFFIYHSDNDPYVPLAKGRELARNLDTRLKLIKDAGHFNTKAGYTKFEIILEDIKKIS